MLIYPPNYFAEEKDFPLAWLHAIRFCIKEGMVIPTEYGPKSKDMCSTIIMTGPAIEQIKRRISHFKFPTREKHLKEYINQFTPEFDASVFEYTYYKRLTKYLPNEFFGDLNQLKIIKDNLRNSRRLQAITWIPDIDLTSTEPPCLQRIWIRVLEEPDNDNYIYSKGQVEVHFTWRSRDMYSAWASNLIGLVFMVYNEILDDEYEIIKLVDFVNAAHIYDSDWEMANRV